MTPDFYTDATGLTVTPAEIILRSDEMARYRSASLKRFRAPVALPPPPPEWTPPGESGAPAFAGVV